VFIHVPNMSYVLKENKQYYTIYVNKSSKFCPFVTGRHFRHDGNKIFYGSRQCSELWRL